jgi:hypothetical protein
MSIDGGPMQRRDIVFIAIARQSSTSSVEEV